ncbi:MAG: SMI1/KNR4 family protein [Deltaproteobacteria bacterium]|nr:SMI1/KNR4 family protein [Deltaproteobacteria bacterium]
MRPLRTCCDGIWEFLRSLEWPALNALKPGRACAEITASLSGLGLSASQELVALFGWKDGTIVKSGDTLDDLHFFPGFYLLSLADATSIYTSMRNTEAWDSCWFPVFANGGGDFYAVKLDRGKHESTEVVGYIRGEPEHPVEYVSLTSMMNTILTCFEKQYFFVSPHGYLEADDEAHARVARRFNPDLAVWQNP